MYVINVINYKFTTSEQKSPKRGGKHTELWIDLSVFEVAGGNSERPNSGSGYRFCFLTCVWCVWYMTRLCFSGAKSGRGFEGWSCRSGVERLRLSRLLVLWAWVMLGGNFAWCWLPCRVGLVLMGYWFHRCTSIGDEISTEQGRAEDGRSKRWFSEWWRQDLAEASCGVFSLIAALGWFGVTNRGFGELPLFSLFFRHIEF